VLYHLRLKGNGAHMIGSCDEVDPASGVPTCATCGYRTDPDFTNPGFRMRRRRLDISCCYDGAVVVSDRFRTLYASLGGSNLRFVDLPKAPGFHHLTCITPVALDYAAMGTQCLRLCTGCGRYLDVVGCGTLVLAPGALLAGNELAFADRYFGSHNEAIPLLLCGELLAKAIGAAGLAGIDACEPVAMTQQG
jgi:hypothetical protein